MAYWRLAGSVLLAAVLSVGAVAQAAASTGAAAHWVGTWAASAQASFMPPAGMVAATPPGTGLDNQTVRMIVRTSIGGSAVRLRFSNAFGARSVTLGDVHVALAAAASGGGSADGSAIEAGSDHAVTFGGRPSVVMPPGADVLSDAVAMTVPALTRLAVSVYVPAATGPATWHALANQTGYITGYGDFDAKLSLPEATTTSHWFWLSDVETAAAPGSYAILTLGDSITDGAHSTRDANHRWPDIMADHLPGVGVLNEGISGNRILHDEAGPNALARFTRDVLEPAGVRDMIVLEGINDIGWPDEKNSRYRAQNVSADDIIAGLQQIIERAHAHGIRVYGATLTPFVGAGYQSPAGEAKREAINAWIRAQGHFDGVIDFDKVTRDPQNPTRYLPAYDSGDHLHPNDAGYQAMGEAAAKVMETAADSAMTSSR